MHSSLARRTYGPAGKREGAQEKSAETVRASPWTRSARCLRRSTVVFSRIRLRGFRPLSRAKANYWVGRTAEALKDKAAATAAYTEATLDRDTFHGLLAMQKLEPGRKNFPIAPPAVPSQDEIEKFNSLGRERFHERGITHFRFQEILE